MALGTVNVPGMTEAEAKEKFISKDEIDVRDIPSKSRNIFGSENIDNGRLSTGDIYLPGLVPLASQQHQQGRYLRSDGTWGRPVTYLYGTIPAHSTVSGVVVDFEEIPTIVKVWNSDGTLVNISKNNPESSTPDKIFGEGSFATGGNSKRWRFHCSGASFVYEAIVMGQ